MKFCFPVSSFENPPKMVLSFFVDDLDAADMYGGDFLKLFVLFIIDMIETFFTRYKNIMAVIGINIFKSIPHDLVIQFREINDLLCLIGKINYTQAFVMDKPKIAIIVFFQVLHRIGAEKIL